jgi:hypothetical protein
MTKKDNNISQEPSEQNMKPNTNTCKPEYTDTQILIHNIPLLSMYVLGVVIVSIFSLFWGILFIVYIIISNILFMIWICKYCPHYGTRTSVCGYGLVTKKLTKRKSPREFNKAFKRYIAVLFPDWFAPLFVGIYLLTIEFDWILLILVVAFTLIAFVGVLYVSKSDSCDTCKLRKNCPWMKICSGGFK